MRQNFENSLKGLDDRILYMGVLAEEAIEKAVQALQDRDLKAAEEVVRDDDKVDDMYNEIEDLCLHLLATQQPMAKDLRRIITCLKIINDLERMADMGSNISKITLRNGDNLWILPLKDIPKMATIAQGMLRKSLNSFVNNDIEQAQALKEEDHQVDHLYKKVLLDIAQFIAKNPEAGEQAGWLLLVARQLERLADRATNIGEFVIYNATATREGLNV